MIAQNSGKIDANDAVFLAFASHRMNFTVEVFVAFFRPTLECQIFLNSVERLSLRLCRFRHRHMLLP